MFEHLRQSFCASVSLRIGPFSENHLYEVPVDCLLIFHVLDSNPEEMK